MNNIKILEGSNDTHLEFLHGGVSAGLRFPLPLMSIVKASGEYGCCALNCISRNIFNIRKTDNCDLPF